MIRKNLDTIRQKIILIYHLVELEGTLWISGLFFLAFVLNPVDSHFSICPLANLGFEFCPGCGLGSSVSFIFRGEFINSFNKHPLGSFAILVLSHRIFKIINSNRRKYD